jgi:DNA-binding NtrC family response regulator
MSGSATAQRARRQIRPLVSIGAQTLELIARIADSHCPVLIAGERGVGKRTVAKEIHAQSHRSRAPFIEINCSGTTVQGIRSAVSGSATVYFAEVGNLDLSLQDFILDACFDPQAATSSRLLFGTSRDLHEEVKTWRLREELYYLISNVTLQIPPLRCRKADIPALTDELLTQYSIQFDRPRPVLRDEIIEFLMEHNWPENLTELQTAIKTFVAIEDQSISLAALKTASPTLKSTGHRAPLLLKDATRAASSQIERRLICEVLTLTNGNRKKAARELGISYKALLYKIKQIDSAPVTRRDGVAL